MMISRASYVSRLLGEHEVRRTTQSGSRSQSTSRSQTTGQNYSRNAGTTSGSNSGGSEGYARNYGGFLTLLLKGRSRQFGWNWSRSHSTTAGVSRGSSTSTTDAYSDATTTGWNEGVHKRSLLNADEIGRFLSRIDDRGHPAYPGLALAILPGRDPLLARRVNYFEAPVFAGRFDPHPDHPPPPTLAELAAMAQRPATRGLPSPDPRPNRSSLGFWQAIASFLRTVFWLLRWTWSAAWKLTAIAAVVIVGIVLLREDPTGAGAANSGNAAASGVTTFFSEHNPKYGTRRHNGCCSAGGAANRGRKNLSPRRKSLGVARCGSK